jgi:hypothetical protein
MNEEILTRIAVALEQIALELASRSEPPPRATTTLTPLPAPASAPPARQWAVGMVHAPDHKPLKENRRGLFCPTKLEDGSWCQWTA